MRCPKKIKKAHLETDVAKELASSFMRFRTNRLICFANWIICIFYKSLQWDLADEIPTGKPCVFYYARVAKNQPDDTRKNVKKLRIM